MIEEKESTRYQITWFIAKSIESRPKSLVLNSNSSASRYERRVAVGIMNSHAFLREWVFEKPIVNSLRFFCFFQPPNKCQNNQT